MVDTLKRMPNTIRHKVKVECCRAAGIPLYHITSSNRFQYTWFRIAKNGTRTLLSILQETTYPDVHDSFTPYFKSRHANKFKFCFIRNPWDRLVSCYFDKVVNKKIFTECWDKDFDYFVKFAADQDLSQCNQHIQLQSALFPTDHIDYIARFEDFEKETGFILNQKLGLRYALVLRNPSNHFSYARYYDEELMNIVLDQYRADVELGGYTFAK